MTTKKAANRLLWLAKKSAYFGHKTSRRRVLETSSSVAGGEEESTGAYHHDGANYKKGRGRNLAKGSLEVKK